ncbi:MAG: hypothetical protein KGZ86_00910 [Candidatus Latescibacteria bacterium]|nr:hypothetical protein [Candidatus Latescibacterota bacterium]
MAKAKAFDIETQYGIFAPCLQAKRLTDLITDYNTKGIPIPSFIRYQPYPVVSIYRITNDKRPRIDTSNKGKPPSEGGASPLVSHNESENMKPQRINQIINYQFSMVNYQSNPNSSIFKLKGLWVRPINHRPGLPPARERQPERSVIPVEACPRIVSGTGIQDFVLTATAQRK